MAGTAGAQVQPETRGRIHLSFEPDRIVQHRHIDAFEPFDVYVLIEFDDVTSLPTMGMLEAALRFHSSIAFGDSDWYSSSSHTVYGLTPGLMEFWIIWGDCLPPNVELKPVAHFVALLQEDATNAFIGIEGIEGGSFDPDGPGWHSCSLGTSYLFGSEQGHWSQLSINSSVPVDGGSWGSLKALYGEVTP
jgi:hypothetical protein